MNQTAAPAAVIDANATDAERNFSVPGLEGLQSSSPMTEAYNAIAGMLTGTDRMFDQRLCKTWLQSIRAPLPQPATGDDVSEDHARYPLVDNAIALQINATHQPTDPWPMLAPGDVLIRSRWKWVRGAEPKTDGDWAVEVDMCGCFVSKMSNSKKSFQRLKIQMHVVCHILSEKELASEHTLPTPRGRGSWAQTVQRGLRETDRAALTRESLD